MKRHGSLVIGIGDWANPPHYAIEKEKPSSNSLTKSSSSLTKFVRENCACWDGFSKTCIGIDVFNWYFRKEGPCWVMYGKPCEYFRKYVLCPKDYPYPPFAFQRDASFEKRVRRLYGKIDKSDTEDTGRKCPDCGASLKKNARYCDRCSYKRKLESQRRSRRKKKDKDKDPDETVN